MAAFTALAIALLAAGTATKAAGQIKAGNAAKDAGLKQQDAANDEAALSDFNAHIADLQAKDAIARGQEDENRFRTGVRGMIGAQRAGFAAGNIDVGFGSAVDVQADAAYRGELDALTIRTNAAREAWGYQVSAADLRRRGEIQRKEGANLAAAGEVAQSASRLDAVGTVLTGAGSIYSSKYGFGKK